MVKVSDKLAAWNVREEEYPSQGSIEEKLKFLLRYAVLAPSGPNTQPWKLSQRGSRVSVLADFSRALPKVDPNHRTLYMSNGCLLTNLLVAAEHFSFGYDVDYLPDGVDADRIATVDFKEKGMAKNFPDLFNQITNRRS